MVKQKRALRKLANEKQTFLPMYNYCFAALCVFPLQITHALLVAELAFAQAD